jgi:putative RNA 2'-phosphotransferase
MTRGSEQTAASKFLSYVLRHNPAAIGVGLDPNGWIAISTLLDASAAHGRPISPEALRQILTGPGRQRFQTDGTRIRAAHGHTIPVDLQLQPRQPPDRLYHGTIARYLPGIRAEGLKPGNRTHVHLAADPATAVQTAARRGKPVILIIDAAAAHQHGHHFYQAANGTWLTTHLPAQWITESDEHNDP